MGYGAGSPGHEKTPLPCDGEWGWKDGWFSEAGLLAATEDEGESTEAEQGGGGGLGDGIKLGIGHGLTSAEHVAISKAGMAGKK